MDPSLLSAVPDQYREPTSWFYDQESEDFEERMYRPGEETLYLYGSSLHSTPYSLNENEDEEMAENEDDEDEDEDEEMADNDNAYPDYIPSSHRQEDIEAIRAASTAALNRFWYLELRNPCVNIWLNVVGCHWSSDCVWEGESAGTEVEWPRDFEDAEMLVCDDEDEDEEEIDEMSFWVDEEEEDEGYEADNEMMGFYNAADNEMMSLVDSEEERRFRE